MHLRRTAAAAAASASACASAFALAKPAPPSDANQSPEYRFGWETAQYGGAGGVKLPKSRPVKRQLSSAPDEWQLFRIASRSALLVERLDESVEETSQRPEEVTLKATEGYDLTDLVDKACHRQSAVLWNAYMQCIDLEKGGHSACNGWWAQYQHSVEKCSYDVMWKVLRSMTEQDPDPNVQKIRAEVI